MSNLLCIVSIIPFLFFIQLRQVLADEHLENSALIKEISNSEEWWGIVHYKKTWWGVKSSIDSQKFFLAENGKTQPEAELVATLKLFNSDNIKQKCLFPARYKVLSEKFTLEPYPKCVDLEQFYKDLQLSGVSLLFTDAYMNNPSSMFGHTLFRIDTKRKGTQLLAHGVNYGVSVHEMDTNPVLFAIFGLTGGYYGGFTVKPYYNIINTYNNIENRDIWEFNLAFSQRELDLLVDHLWELSHNQARYYFFSKNCSYFLLEILDAVRPSLRLSEEFPFHAIPLDTLKVVKDRDGLIKGMRYRPSRQAQIKHKYSQLSPVEREVLFSVIQSDKVDLATLSSSDKGGVLETAYQYLQYQLVKKTVNLKDFRQKSFAILKERQGLVEKSELIELRDGQNPLYTHASKRISFNWGIKNSRSFEAVSFFPAYHTLTDYNFGLLLGAEIVFLEPELRFYNSNDFVFQGVDILSIKSLSPANKLFNPISYQLKFDIERVFNSVLNDEGYATTFQVGSGKTFEISDRFFLYGMFNNYLSLGGFLPHNYWMGIGVELGALLKLKSISINATAEARLTSSHFSEKAFYHLECAYHLNKDFALVAEVNLKDNYGRDENEYMFGGRYNF